MTKKQFKAGIKAGFHSPVTVEIKTAEGNNNARTSGTGGLNNATREILLAERERLLADRERLLATHERLLDEISAQRRLTGQVLEQSKEQINKLINIIQQLTARNKALTEQLKIKSHDKKTI